MVTVLWGAFALSLFGSIHCMGMCGGFALLAKGTNSSFFSRSLLIYLVGKTVTYSALVCRGLNRPKVRYWPRLACQKGI
jgi:sulfite exporter TauE/SafE